MRVAIVGVGNCASSFVQGVEYYKDADPNDFVPGLMHVDLGGYHIRDIKFTAAFDIDADKVGKDLSEAIWRGQNNTIKFADVPKLGIKVERGMTHDGLGKYLKQKIKKAPGRDRRHRRDPAGDPDRRGRLLPARGLRGGDQVVRRAGAGGRLRFVNCIPVFIAREPYWQKRFKRRALPIIGDDIKSQVGATIMHRTLARLFHERGVRLERTSQLNVGGNMDFYNMLERERLESKKISKTNAVTSMLDYKLPADDVYIGPSDYVPWLKDRKWAHIRDRGRVVRRRAAQHGAEARGLGLAELGRHRDRRRAPVQAGAQQRDLAARSTEPSSYLMKSPPKQVPDPSRARPAPRSSSRDYATSPRSPPRPKPRPKADARKHRGQIWTRRGGVSRRCEAGNWRLNNSLLASRR